MSVNRKYNGNQKQNRKTNEIKEEKTAASTNKEPPSHKMKPKLSERHRDETPSSFGATNVLPSGKRF